ncbi:tetratricopeptide repeat protein [Nocardiopsis sp. B62]|uniref:tetratricopeptide repeat protein n=1 Tax=Nocardiopsis sp. B62 TaxID=2824874 RepID=UPI001B39AA19|nr:tetratricopeptide repeat protein [Nocardiopsis sp. B62]MBQ1080602.1 sel1 repeat family protein [Nocardiopsis sp. B62]
MGDNHGISIQAGDINGPVTVHSPPADAPVPGWVEMALPVHQCDASELGVHSALPGSEDEGLPPYVARDVDDALDKGLAAAAASARGGLVLVTGASTAGKTRALVAALGRTLPDRMLVAPPEGADLRPLPAWLKERAARAPQGWVVWLDDLDRHLSPSGLTPALVAVLGGAGAIVAATIRRNQLETLRPSTAEQLAASEGAGYAVLRTPPIVVERRWNRHEREQAHASGDERLVRAAVDERFGVAEQLAAGPVLEQIWRTGPDSGHPRGYALVAAAVALAQAGVPSPLTREQIQAAHFAYLPDPPPLAEEAEQAWAWATHQRSGMAGLLVPVDHDGRWRAFDYLTLQGPLPEIVWRVALDTATDQDRLDVGLTAYSAGRADVAETAWTPLAKQGHTEAMTNLGRLLEQTGRQKQAQDWFRRAAGQGDTEAMVTLGGLLFNAGRRRKAQDWFRRAAEQGDTSAMFLFGASLALAGRMAKAEDWFRRAAEQGHTEAMVNLGVLLKDAGRRRKAQDWFRRAAEQGHTEAMVNLGVLLKDAGQFEEARTWFLRGGAMARVIALDVDGIASGRWTKP